MTEFGTKWAVHLFLKACFIQIRHIHRRDYRGGKVNLPKIDFLAMERSPRLDDKMASSPQPSPPTKPRCPGLLYPQPSIPMF